MIQVNRIYLIFNRLVTKKFLVDTSENHQTFPCLIPRLSETGVRRLKYWCLSCQTPAFITTDADVYHNNYWCLTFHSQIFYY